MKSTFTILFLTLSVLYRAEHVCGKTVKHTVLEWIRYRNECLWNISSEPIPSGIFCTRMFDKYACWTDGLPNTTVKVHCPYYLPWYDQVYNGFVLRECGPDGQWHTSNTSHSWRDHSQCNADSRNHRDQENQMKTLSYFRVMYTVGYSLTLASLSLAFVILLLFRKLRCTRNYVHANLFASFILRAVSILIRDALLSRDPLDFRNYSDVSSVLTDQTLSNCHIAQVLMQYFVGANYFWLLVEGLYLHNLLVLQVFSGNKYFCSYLFLGWGAPVLFVTLWIIMRYFYENTSCWEINENVAHWWIIRGPILLAIFVNFFIFIRIIQILVSKLKAHQMRYTDYKFRLAKSTLTLIPLLGIHEVVFAVIRVEQTKGEVHQISLFFELFFNSFQGFLVAILYCFVNKEVQSEVKKYWHRWKMGMSFLDDQRNSVSILLGGNGLQYQQDQECHLDYTKDSGNHLCLEPLQIATQFSLRHPHPGAKNSKTFCYIPAQKQEMNTATLEHWEQAGVIEYSESCC